MAALRAERNRQGLSLDWVAGRTGVKLQSIAEFETQQTRPSETTLRKWLKALQLPGGWADTWLDWRVEEEVAEVLRKLRGPRALPAEDVDARREGVRRERRGRSGSSARARVRAVRSIGLALTLVLLGSACASTAATAVMPSASRSLNPGEQIGQFLASHSLDPVETVEPRTASPRPTPTPAPITTQPTIIATAPPPIVSAIALCGAPPNPFRYTLCPGDVARNAVLSPPFPSFCAYFTCVGGFYGQSGWVHRCVSPNAQGTLVYGHTVFPQPPDLGPTPASYWSGSCHFFGGDGPGLFYSP
jgi:transcriptional regulator with XRE-family HTH domain